MSRDAPEQDVLSLCVMDLATGCMTGVRVGWGWGGSGKEQVHPTSELVAVQAVTLLSVSNLGGNVTDQL